MLTALCTVWLLTHSCTDDVLKWQPVPTGTNVTWAGSTLIVPPGITEAAIGCWEGTVRVAHFDSGGEGTPAYFVWEIAPERKMEWENACPIGVDVGGCLPACREGR